MVTTITDYFRRMETFTLKLPALPRLSRPDIIARFPFLNKEEIQDDSVETPSFLELGTVLNEGEQYIDDDEYKHRLGKGPYFGLQQGLWLVDHQNDPELSEFKILTKKGIIIDLPGTKSVGADGLRSFPCLFSGGGRWYLGFRRLEIGLHGRDRVARSRQ